MHSVDLLEEAIELAKRSGFEVRHEWLGESGGGACRVGTRQILFVDLSLTAADQLTQVLVALRSAPTLATTPPISAPLNSLLNPN